MKQAIVTGATGFVGSHLTKALVQQGVCVHAIIRPTSDLFSLQQVDQKLIRFHIYDKERDFKEIFRDIIEEAKPDVVFHLASMVVGNPTAEKVGALLQSNITFGVELLEAMKAYGVRCLVNTGTSWQHYQNADYNPVNLYAATKQAFEDFIAYYVQACGFKVINLHLFDNYGPNDKRKKLLSLMKDAVQKKQVLDMTPGQQQIDLVYIDDVIQAFLLAGEYLTEGEYQYCGTYAVSSGQPMMLRDLVKECNKVIGGKLMINWGGQAYRDREVMVPWNKGKILPGWKPEVSLAEGLRRFWQE